MNVLKRIIQLRTERGWSEYQLAEAAELPQSTISLSLIHISASFSTKMPCFNCRNAYGLFGISMISLPKHVKCRAVSIQKPAAAIKY